MKKLTAVLMTLAFGLMLAGCNTVRGLGQDVSKVGDKIEDKAEKEKKY